MTLTPKTVVLQDLPPAVDRALRQQLGRLPGVEVAADGAPNPHIVVTPAGLASPAGIPRLSLAPGRVRLGAVMAALARALREPALAVPPFVLAGGLLSPAEKKYTAADGRDILLTERETALLLHLARHHPQPVSRERLLREVWNYQDGIDTHTLETHIYRLRQKIETDPAAPAVLTTAAEGYALGSIEAAT